MTVSEGTFQVKHLRGDERPPTIISVLNWGSVWSGRHAGGILHQVRLGFLSYLSHLASVEQVFHDEQVQFLLSVVLGVLVTYPVNAEDLCQCSWPL